MSMAMPNHGNTYRLPFVRTCRRLTHAFWSLVFLLAALLLWRRDLGDDDRMG